MKKLLIGSCGGATGYYLAENFKKTGEYEVIGFDAGNPMASIMWLDKFYEGPRASKEQEFLEFLIRLLNDEDVDYYLPTHSVETRVVAKHEAYIRNNTSAGFIISPYETFEALDNKNTGNVKLENINIPVPALYGFMENAAETSKVKKYPVFVKHNQGSGSHDARKIDSEADLKAYIQLYKDISAYEYIEGKEYTVDALFDNDGRLLGYAQRIRIRQIGGATVRTVTDYSIDVGDYIRKMAETFTFKGVVNFQFILRDGVPYFTDINLRYASGGLPLSVHSGMDIFTLLPRIIDGDLENVEVKIARSLCTMYRHYEEFFS